MKPSKRSSKTESRSRSGWKLASPASSDDSKRKEGGWMQAHKCKPDREKRLRDDSDSDDNLRLGDMKLNKKRSKRSEKRGGSSSSSSSSISSSSSSSIAMGLNKQGKYKKARPTIKRSNVKKATAAKKSNEEGRQIRTTESTACEVSRAPVRKHTNTRCKTVDTSLAETQANRAKIPEDITSIPQLQWYRIRLTGAGGGKIREILKPCRVLSRGASLERRRSDRAMDGATGKALVIQYLTFPDVEKGLYKCADEGELIPFGYASNDGLSATFNDDYLQRYMQQEGKNTNPNRLEATRLFLKGVFDHAREAEKTSRIRAKRDLRDYYDSSEGGDDDQAAPESKQVQFEVMKNTAVNEGDGNEADDLDVPYDDLDAPYTQAITFDPDDFGTAEEKSNEPIRPGDVVEYYSPIFVAGDARGIRQATVLAIDPKNETPLTLSNGEGIPNNTKLKRIKILLDGDLVDHPGIFRPICQFKLKKQRSLTAASGIAMETARFERIMHKNIRKLKEKADSEGFAPMDILVNVKGARAESPEKSPFKITLSARSVGRRPDSMQSLQNESDVDSKSKQKGKSQSEKQLTATARAINLNKENNGSSLGKEKRMSSEPLSLGSSVASFDDSSIESIPVGEMNCRTITREKFANGKAQGNSPFINDSDKSLKKTGSDKCTKARSSNTLTSDSSVGSESSLEIPNCSGLGKKRTSPKSSPILKLGTTVASSPAPCDNGPAKQSRLRRKSLSPPLSTDDTPTSSKSLRRVQGKQPKAAETNATIFRSRRSSSAGSVHSVNGKKSNPIKKSCTLPSALLFTSDDSNDSYHSNENVTRCSKSKKSLPCKHSYSPRPTKRHDAFLPKPSSSPDSVEVVEAGRSKQLRRSLRSSDCSSSDASDNSGSRNTRDKTCGSKSNEPLLRENSPDSLRPANHHNENKLVQKMPTANYMKNASSFGWTKGKAGWKKKSESGHGFSIGRKK